MKILITGSSGFIGFHLAKKLLNDGHLVTGLDNLNDYYSQDLKQDRLEILKDIKGFFTFHNLDLNSIQKLKFPDFDIAINLAAQPGVRIGWDKNSNYIDSNILGFHTFLDFCHFNNIKKIIFASSSSVYGDQKNSPFKEDSKLSPTSVYASSKTYNEHLAKSFSTLFGSDIIGLRFFTVYGSLGRPDMAYYLFSEKIKNSEEISLFNDGDMSRDMTHISDIVNGINLSINYLMENKTNFEVFNLGNDYPIKTKELLEKLELKLEKKAIIKNIKSKNESFITHADLSKSREILKYNPKVDLDEGIDEFMSWYISYVSI